MGLGIFKAQIDPCNWNNRPGNRFFSSERVGGVRRVKAEGAEQSAKRRSKTMKLQKIYQLRDGVVDARSLDVGRCVSERERETVDWIIGRLTAATSHLEWSGGAWGRHQIWRERKLDRGRERELRASEKGHWTFLRSGVTRLRGFWA